MFTSLVFLIKTAAHYVCAQYWVCDYFALPNMRYANGVDHLHRHPSMQLCVELPLELFDRNLDSDKVYWN
jgi:hypothetical protein